MSYGWENNPNGICEDAPCCGCCGPQGDGRFDMDGPYEDPDYYDDYTAMHDRDMDPLCERCGVDTSYGSTMWGSREVWYCEDCEQEVCAGPASTYATNNLLHPNNL